MLQIVSIFASLGLVAASPSAAFCTSGPMGAYRGAAASLCSPERPTWAKPSMPLRSVVSTIAASYLDGLQKVDPMNEMERKIEDMMEKMVEVEGQREAALLEVEAALREVEDVRNKLVKVESQKEAAIAELKEIKQKLADADLEKWSALMEIGDVRKQLAEALAQVQSLRSGGSTPAAPAYTAPPQATRASQDFEVATKEAKSALYEPVEEVERPLSYMEMLNQQRQDQEEATKPRSYLESLSPQQPAVVSTGYLDSL